MIELPGSSAEPAMQRPAGRPGRDGSASYSDDRADIFSSGKDRRIRRPALVVHVRSGCGSKLDRSVHRS